MKFCPHCGFEIVEPSLPFCSECGKSIFKNPNTEVDEKKISSKNNSCQADFDAEYDGYYDDIIPDDSGEIKSNIDKQIVRKIGIIVCCVVVIISICVLLMNLL